MRTNKRFNLQNGYSKLALVMLILAMCFTAFVAVPFCNTQASALSAHATNLVMPNNGQIHGWSMDHHVGKGVYFGSSDQKGIDAIKKETPGWDDKFWLNEYLNDKNWTIDYRDTQGLQFMPKYYDLSNGESTSLSGGLTFDSFKGQPVTKTISLSGMDGHFGVGSGHSGVNKSTIEKNLFGSKYFNYNNYQITTQKTSNSIRYDSKGISDERDGKSGNARSWRAINGYFYTFIKVPSEIAPFLKLNSVSAVMQSNYKLNCPSYNYDYYMTPVMNVDLGTKNAPSDNTDLSISNGRNYTIEAGKEGESISSKPTTLNINSQLDSNSQWIKISFGMASHDGAVTKTAKTQEWLNYLQVSDIKLTFTLSAPIIESDVNASLTPTYTNGPRIASFEVAYDKAIGNGSIEQYLNPTNNTVFNVVLYDVLENKEIALNDKNKVGANWATKLDPNRPNSTDDQYGVFTWNFQFKVFNNGKYQVRMYAKQGNTNVLVQTSAEFSVEGIDYGKPNVASHNNSHNYWFTDATQYIKFNNFVDTIDAENSRGESYSASGIKSLNTYLWKIDDNNEGFKNWKSKDIADFINDPNHKYQNKNYTVYNHLYDNIGLSQDVKLQDLVADFYTKKSYGTYVMAYAVTDKAGNVSDYTLFYIKYDNGAEIKFDVNNNIEISKDNINWVKRADYKSNDWVTSPKIYLRFQVNEDFHFPLTFNLALSNGAPFDNIYFKKVTKQNVVWYEAYSKTSSGETEGVDLRLLDIDLSYSTGEYCIFGGGSALKLYKETAFRLNVDTDKPFNKQQMVVKNPIAIDGLFNANIWYTYRDNETFLTENPKLMIGKYKEGGMYFEVDMSSSTLDPTIFEQYIFKINGKELEKQLFNGSNILLFIPLENLEGGNNVILEVTDQAGNKTTGIKLFASNGASEALNIKYDDRKYKIDSLKFDHLPEVNNFITLWTLGQGVTFKDEADFITKAKELPTEVINGFNGNGNYYFERGTQLYIKVNKADPIYEFVKMIVSGNGVSNEIVDSKNSTLFKFTFGDLQNNKVPVVNNRLEIKLYENIDLKVFAYNFELSKSIDKPLHFTYNAQDLQFKLKYISHQSNLEYIINNSSQFTVGATSDAKFNDSTGTILWHGIKDYTGEVQRVVINVNDTVNMVKTKGEQVFYIQIDQAKVTAEIGLDQKFEENGGVQYTNKVYGDAVDIKVNYITSREPIYAQDRQYVNMHLAAFDNAGNEVSGKNLRVGVYALRFVINTNMDNSRSHNYKFELYYNDAPIEPNLKINQREVHIKLSHSPFVYGDDFAVDGITKKLNVKDLESMVIDKPNDNSIRGTIKLVTKEGNPVNRLTNAGGPYYYDIKGLYLEGYADNIKLVLEGSETFNIQKRDIKLKFNIPTTFEYGRTIDFLSKYTITFDNIAPSDDVNDLITYLTCDGTTTRYNVGKYQVVYNVKKQHINYNFVNDNSQSTTTYTIAFEVTPKTINIALDAIKSKLQFEFANRDLAINNEFNKYLVADFGTNFDKIKNQFIDISDFDNYDFSGANQAFTLINPETGLPYESVINVGSYFIKAVENYDSLVKYNGSVRNYKFVPTTDKQLVISPKYVDAFINAYNGTENNFSNLYRPFGEPFAKPITSFDFTVDGVKNMEGFSVMIKTNGKYVDAIQFMNDKNSPVGKYTLEVAYTGFPLNYVINQSVVDFEIIKALLSFDLDANKEGINKELTKNYNGSLFSKTAITIGDVTLLLKINNTYNSANVGTYKNAVTVVGANTNDINYSGVKLVGNKDFDITINKFVVNEITGVKFDRVYDGTDKFVFSVNGLFDTITGTATLPSKNAGTYQNVEVKYSGNGVNNYDFTKVNTLKQIVVNKKEVGIIFNGNTTFNNSLTIANENVTINGVVEGDNVDSLKADLKINDNTKAGFIGYVVNDTKEINVVLENVNYSGNITISFVKADASSIIIKITYTNNITNIIYNGNKFDMKFVAEKLGESEYVINNEYLIVTYYEFGTQTKVTPKDAGKYTAKAEYKDTTNPNVAPATLTVDFEIKPVSVDVTSEFDSNQSLNKDFDGKTDATLKLKGTNFGVLTENVTISVVANYQSAEIGSQNINYTAKLVTNNKANLNNYKLVNATGIYQNKGNITKRGETNPENKVLVTIPNIIYGDEIVPKFSNNLLPNINDITGSVEYDRTAVGDNVQITSHFTSNYYVVELKNTTISVAKRDLKVSMINMELTAGTLISDIIINAVFTNYVDSDVAIIRDIQNKYLAVDLPQGYGDKLKLGKVNVKKNNNFTATPEQQAVLNRYNINLETDSNGIVGYIIVIGVKVEVQIVGNNYEIEFGDLYNNPQANEILEKYIKNITKFKNIKDNTIIDVDFNKFDIKFVDTQGKKYSSLSEANQGVYSIQIEYKPDVSEDIKTYFISKYANNNISIVINPRKVDFRFNPNFFDNNKIKFYNYGDMFDANALLNEMILVYVTGTNTQLPQNLIHFKGEFKLTQGGSVVDKVEGLYNAGEYQIYMSDVWFATNDSVVDNPGNFIINLPSDISNYKFVINKIKATLTFKDNNNNATKTYLDADPDFNNFNAIATANVAGSDYNLNVDISSASRVAGNNVGLYDFILRGTLSNSNFYLETNNDGSLVVSNKFEITRREISVNGVSFITAKTFDNNTSIKEQIVIDYVKGNGSLPAGLPKVSSLINVTARFDNANVGENKKIILTFSLKDNNFKLVQSNDFKLNNELYEGASLVDKDGITFAIPSTSGTINQAILSINSDKLANPTKSYDGTANFDNIDLNVLDNDIKNLLSKKGIYINTATFDSANAGTNKTLTYGLVFSFKEAILNINANIKITLNGKVIELVNTTNNEYRYDSTINNASIDYAKIKASSDSIIKKVYDGTNAVNPSNQDNPTSIVIKAHTFGKDVVNLSYSVNSITFPAGNAGKYKIDVQVTIKEGSNPNYILENNTIQVDAEILQRTVTIKIKDNFTSTIFKEYDGSTSIKVNLTPYDYDIIGILPEHIKLVGIDVNGKAEFDTPYVGDNKSIVFKNAMLKAINAGGNEYLNYKLTNTVDSVGGQVVGLKGSITPRPVIIDTAHVKIFNTRYFGADGSNYTVKLIDSLDLGDTQERTVSIYMPIMETTATAGILPQDQDFGIKLHIDMRLDNKLNTLVQSVYLKENGKQAFVTSSNDPNAKSAANSYKIANLNEVFVNNKLAVGTNALSNNYKNQVWIQPFEITNEFIFFDESENNVFHKTYDGNANLNDRVMAKVGKFEIVNGKNIYQFLLDDIKGINVLNKLNAYPSVDVGEYTIDIELDSELIMRNAAMTGRYIISNSLDRHFQKQSKIVERVVNVYIKPKDKVYDGTNSAFLHENYEFEQKFGISSKLEGLMPRDEGKVSIKCDAKYILGFDASGNPIPAINVGNASLYCDNLRLSSVDGKRHRNYVAKFKVENADGTTSYLDNREYTGLKITQRTLNVYVGDMEIEYNTGLPQIADIGKFISEPRFTGLAKGDTIPQEFLDSIVYKYTKLKPNQILPVTNALISDIVIEANENLLPNYKLNLVKGSGNVLVLPQKIGVVLDEALLSNLSSKFGDKINNITSIIKFVDKNGIALPKAMADKLLKYVVINGLPSSMDGVKEEGYKLTLEVIPMDGYLNYDFDIDKFNNNAKYVYRILPIDITIRDTGSGNSFEYEVDRDFKQNLLDRYKPQISQNAYSRVEKELGTYVNGVFTPYPADFAFNKIARYPNLAIRFTAKEISSINGKDYVDNLNYNVTVFPIGDFEITPKSILINMQDVVLTYNGKVQVFPEEYMGIPEKYKNDIKFVILDSQGNIVDAKTLVNIGDYIALLYTTNENIKLVSNRVYTGTIQNTEIANLAAKGNAMADFRIAKIKVANVGLNSFKGNPMDVDTIINLIMAGIKLDNKDIPASNITLDFDRYADFTVAGIHNIAIKIKGKDADKYEIINPNVTFQIVTSSISNKDKSVVVETIDKSDIKHELVDAVIFTKKGTASDKEKVLANQNLIGTAYSMIYAQFKQSNSIDSGNIALGSTMKVKLKVDPSLTKKNLYLVTDGGMCKEIENFTVTNENGITYAVFETEDLGWFVFADAPSDNGSVVAYTVIGIVSVLLAGLVGVLVYIIVKKAKATK